MRLSVEERLWPKVEKHDADCPCCRGCWHWTGSRAYGYGQVWSGKLTAAGNPVPARAHRLAYELLVGPIPEGYHVHHECGNRSCVNPDHLRPIAPGEHSCLTRNGGDKDHCIRGHRFDRVARNGKKQVCGQCQREAGRKHYAKLKAELGTVAWADRTHCPQGHAYDDENTYWHGTNRHCRICRREHWRAWFARKKQAA